LVVIFVFAAVAVVDLVQTLRTSREPPPSLLRDGAITIVELEPVVDLRPPRDHSAGTFVDAVTLVGEQWSTPEKRGVWVIDDGATLDIAVTDGGHRVLLLECLSVRGRWRVSKIGVEINGRPFGAVEIEEGWQRYRLPLPEEAVERGVNRIVFRLPERTTATGRRSILLRRFGLFLDQEVGSRAIERRSAVVVDPVAETAIFRAPGSLEIPFTLDDRVDALQFRYSFASENDHAEIVVCRPQGIGAGHDAEIRRRLSAAARTRGRVRIPLHGRRGEFLLRISAFSEDRSARLNITSLRLIEEGDPTRRPRRGRLRSR
jgi:hypothetical protein